MSSDMAGADVWTTANLVLIAIGVVLALLVIVWGARLKRQRRAAEQAIEERVEETQALAPAPPVSPSLDDIAPAAPETEPLPAPVLAPEAGPEAGPAPTPVAPEPIPVAPAPPPLADMPVVATPAPVDPTPPAPPASTAGDALTQLKGVGPKLAARLNELGITRFAQIAALSPDEATALDAQLGSFQGRMARDRWVEQAGYLANDDRAGFEAAFGRL